MIARLEPRPELPREIFVLSGQSNSSGRAPLGTAPASYPFGYRIKNYTNAGAWADAVEAIDSPVGQIDAVSADSNAAMGAGMAFADRLASLRPMRDIGLVPCARGSTSITQWTPSLSRSTLYGSMLARTLEAADAGVLKGLIWYQGEANSVSGQGAIASTWAARFLDIAEDFCTDLELPDLKIIVTELSPNAAGHPYWETVQAQQRSLDGARNGNVACVSAADLSYQAATNVHLDAAGYVALGNRYADAMAAMLG